MGVANRNRAAAAVLAAIAGFGALAGLVIAATTTSVNAGAGAGSAPGAAAAMPAPATTSTTSAGPSPAVRPSGDASSRRAVAGPHATAGVIETTAARHATGGSPGARPATTATTTGTGSSTGAASTSGASPGPPTSPGSSSPTACSSGDVALTTTTDASSYHAGAPVRVTTTVRDVVGCVFDPAAPASSSSSGSGCATTVAVTDAQGDQVWPVPGQVEQCAQPARTTLVPGQTLDVTVVWTGLANLPGSPLDVPAPPGQYQAVGTWSWSGPAGASGSSGPAPVTGSATSAPFTLH